MKRSLACLLLLFCAACATPQAQQYAPAAVTPKLDNGMFITSDGSRLPYRLWLPKGDPKAVVVALHGFNDYSRAFEIPAEYMSVRGGVAVVAYDQRGFGAAPSRGIWAGEDNIERDVADMVTAIREYYPHKPLFLLGESMGGAVAVAAETRPGFPQVDGLILSAPALWGGDTMNPLLRMSVYVMAHSFPGKLMTGQDLHVLGSDNFSMLLALSTDPKVIKATRVDTIWGLLQLMDKGYANFSKVNVPMLLLYGANDQVIPIDPIKKVLSKAPANTTAAYYPLGFHMLLRDLHGDVPVRDMLSWMDSPRDPLPSGNDIWAKAMLK